MVADGVGPADDVFTLVAVFGAQGHVAEVIDDLLRRAALGGDEGAALRLRPARAGGAAEDGGGLRAGEPGAGAERAVLKALDNAGGCEREDARGAVRGDL